MRPGGNLFLKIFAAFWLVTVAVLASWMLSSDYFDSRPPGPGAAPPPKGPRGGEHRTAPPHQFMLSLIYDLQNLEGAELQSVIDDAAGRHRIDIYLLKNNGEELFDREVPEAVNDVASKLQGRRRRAMATSPEGRLSAHSIYNPDYGPLRAVFAFERRERPILTALGGNPLLRLLLAIFISGLVCYGLSRLLTSRIKELQGASRRLAEGDLTARITVRQTGGDETDELARDFNSMAGQIEERMKAQKRLLSDVSHELRSPLARLRIALALAEKRTDDSDEYFERIEREAQRLEELIGQLLLSRPREVPMDSHIDLVGLLSQLCDDASFEGKPSGKSAALYTEVDEWVVATHGDLLHKAFENVLRNALAHTPENSEIKVRLDVISGECQITIEDRGPGVPEDELDKIFGEFYRVDTARTRESGGNGLGLAIARRAIAEHGGKIGARNTTMGLAISVTLPVQN
jgi:signal transduction histidine kinase